jgi:hypothetical protein
MPAQIPLATIDHAAQLMICSPARAQTDPFCRQTPRFSVEASYGIDSSELAGPALRSLSAVLFFSPLPAQGETAIRSYI